MTAQATAFLQPLDFDEVETPSQRMLRVTRADAPCDYYPLVGLPGDPSGPPDAMSLLARARVILNSRTYCTLVDVSEPQASFFLVTAMRGQDPEFTAIGGSMRLASGSISPFYGSPTAAEHCDFETYCVKELDVTADALVRFVRELSSLTSGITSVDIATFASPPDWGNPLLEAHAASASLKESFHAELDEDREAWLFARDG